jgi:circadian clock protein KaiB
MLSVTYLQYSAMLNHCFDFVLTADAFRAVVPDEFQQNSLENAQGKKAIEAILAKLEQETYVLRLYVSGQSLRSLRAIQQVEKLCREHLQGRYELEVIDIRQNPERLEQDQIFATPTLVKELPPPLQRLIGDMTDTEKVMVSLDL